MQIDWIVLATIAAPIITLFIGVWVNRRFEDRPTLISYYGHVSAFLHTADGGQQFHVHTHAVVLRNTGRKPATDVRLHHNILPDFNIWPTIVYHVETLLDGTKDIVIPALVPNEEITISYLYFPPVTYSQINAGIKCEQGFANAIPVLLQRQYPRWVNRTTALILLVGVIFIAYLLYVGVSRMFA